ncbi:hypothetical protein GCM10027034_28530 [Ramlibacter solisilvae]|uniref:Uncharacterized protein n=1 Tax=Ramlibacter tataouinensis TaxID=94132 RepID=A0A127JR85_9BURK|nr:hypothetical protein [Ramlibacter tataouinensis]AMO22476.1 hypothetical protein UC35_05680 [Ramlibacter tataouinensis]
MDQPQVTRQQFELDELGPAACLLVTLAGAAAVVVCVTTVLKDVLGLHGFWSPLASAIALGFWWQSDFVLKLGRVRRVRDEAPQARIVNDQRAAAKPT